MQHLNYHTKITFTQTSTVGLASSTLICMAEADKINLLRDFLNQEFVQRICGHPLAATLLCSILFSIEVEEKQASIKSQVRAVEVRTGHHAWKSRKEPPALGDLIALTARMSGCDTKIASGLRKQKMLAEMINFVEERADMLQSDHNDLRDDQAEMVKNVLENIKPLKQRATAQRIDIEFVQRRVKTQLDAVSTGCPLPRWSYSCNLPRQLYHLVAQNDALSAQEMSQDCKLLATDLSMILSA